MCVECRNMHMYTGAGYERIRARVPLGREGIAGNIWARCRNVLSHVGCYKVVNCTITHQPGQDFSVIGVWMQKPWVGPETGF